MTAAEQGLTMSQRKGEKKNHRRWNHIRRGTEMEMSEICYAKKGKYEPK